MANVALDLYRACRARAWGNRNALRQQTFVAREGSGSLYPDYVGFEREDGARRPPDVTTFTDGNGVVWVRGVNDRDSANRAYVDWKEGVSLSGSPGCFGYGPWFYFLLSEGTPVPDSLSIAHSPSRRDDSHHSLRCLNAMTQAAYEGALDTLARAAIAKAVEDRRNALYFSN